MIPVGEDDQDVSGDGIELYKGSWIFTLTNIEVGRHLTPLENLDAIAEQIHALLKQVAQ